MNFTKHHPFMEYNSGYYVKSLDKWAKDFEADGVQYLGTKWSANGTEYYSMLFNPCGYVVLELISDDVSDEHKSNFKEG